MVLLPVMMHGAAAGTKSLLSVARTEHATTKTQGSGARRASEQRTVQQSSIAAQLTHACTFTCWAGVAVAAEKGTEAGSSAESLVTCMRYIALSFICGHSSTRIWYSSLRSGVS